MMPLQPEDLQKNEYYQQRLIEAKAQPDFASRERALLQIRYDYLWSASDRYNEIRFSSDTELLLCLTAKPSEKEDERRSEYQERLQKELKDAETMQRRVGEIDTRNTEIIQDDLPGVIISPPMFYSEARDNAFRAQMKLDDATKELQNLVNAIHAATLGHYDSTLSVLDNFKAAETFCAKKQTMLDKRFSLPEAELPF